MAWTSSSSPCVMRSTSSTGTPGPVAVGKTPQKRSAQVSGMASLPPGGQTYVFPSSTSWRTATPERENGVPPPTSVREIRSSAVQVASPLVTVPRNGMGVGTQPSGDPWYERKTPDRVIENFQSSLRRVRPPSCRPSTSRATTVGGPELSLGRREMHTYSEVRSARNRAVADGYNPAYPIRARPGVAEYSSHDPLSAGAGLPAGGRTTTVAYIAWAEAGGGAGPSTPSTSASDTIVAERRMTSLPPRKEGRV